MVYLKSAIAVLLPLLAAFLVLSLPCRASDPKADSKKLFADGIKLFNNGEIEEALGKFHKAYVAYPHWKIRKNIGLCYMKLGENVLALQELYGYLEEGKSDLTEKEKQTVMNVIFEILQNVGIVRFLQLPPAAEVVVDGQSNSDAALGKDIYVDPGLHVVSVLTADDKVLYRQEMNLAPGELKEIDISKNTKPIEAAPGKTSEIPGWQEVGPPKKEKKLKVLHPAIFGSAVGLTLVFGASAIGTGAKAKQLNDKYFDESTPDSERAGLEADGKKFQRDTNALIGVCAGMAAVSLVLFFFTDFKMIKKKKQEAPPALTLLGDPSTGTYLLSAQLRF
jgi:tetratricopeptide (TPR) repeat protein